MADVKTHSSKYCLLHHNSANLEIVIQKSVCRLNIILLVSWLIGNITWQTRYLLSQHFCSVVSRYFLSWHHHSFTVLMKQYFVSLSVEHEHLSYQKIPLRCWIFGLRLPSVRWQGSSSVALMGMHVGYADAAGSWSCWRINVRVLIRISVVSNIVPEAIADGDQTSGKANPVEEKKRKQVQVLQYFEVAE